MALGFELDTEAGIPVIAFAGELDSATVDEFDAAILETAREADGCVIVDLTRVVYIDSQSFGRLLRAHVFLEQEHGDVAIVAGEGEVARVIHIFGADYLLSVFSDREKAAQYLRPICGGASSYSPKHSR